MKASKHAILHIVQIVFFITLLTVSPTYGVSDRATVAALGGIKDIFLRVNMSDSQFAQKTVLTTRLKRATEKQLRRAGINLLSQEEYDRLRKSERHPLARLDIGVTMNEITRLDLYLCNITIQVRQVVFLARKPVVKMILPTWEKRFVGFDTNPEAALAKVGILVGKFIDAYHLANPR